MKILYAGGLFIAVALAAVGCTDNSGNGNANPGAGGSGGGGGGTTGAGGTTGSGGMGGTSTGGTGGTPGTGGTSTGGTGGTTPGFMSVLPCPSESNYGAGTTTVSFGVNGALAYDPKCLKVPAGTTVTFSGDFSIHPLLPSSKRGAQTGNPITITADLDGGMNRAFTFPTPGFYAYFCAEHSDDSGTLMDGVIWVQ